MKKIKNNSPLKIVSDQIGSPTSTDLVCKITLNLVKTDNLVTKKSLINKIIWHQSN